MALCTVGMLCVILQVNEDRVRHLQEANNAEELAANVKREAEAAERKHNKEVRVGQEFYLCTNLLKYEGFCFCQSH